MKLSAIGKSSFSPLQTGFIAALMILAPLLTPTARGQNNFTVTLSGPDEVPPSGSSATGSGTLTLNGDNTLTYNIAYSGLTGPFTAAHIHGPAGPGTNAGVLFPLNNVPNTPVSGTLSGTTTALTGGQVSDLRNGLHYANIHSASFADGEIRGQFTTSIFADANLETAVREALGKPTGTITVADMQSLTLLNASLRGITNLTGLDTASNLSSLVLDANTLSDLSPLSGLNNLFLLSLFYTAVSDLTPLSALTNLQTLVVGFNPQITNLFVLTNLTQLQGLSLDNILSGPFISSSNIFSVVARLTNLDFLSLSGNTISDLTPLAGSTNLTVLVLNDNLVTNLTGLGGLVKLNWLNLEGNSVTDLSVVAGLNRLEVFDVCRNLVSDLTATGRFDQFDRLGSVQQSNNELLLVGYIGNLDQFVPG